jgi:diphthine-ammonia ligase
MLEGVAKIGGQRKALHVQSLSYWAAANIGPYSQTITVRPFMLGSVRILMRALHRLINDYSWLVKSL